MTAITELLWAFIGLLLTVSGTLIEAAVSTPPWLWAEQGVRTYSLGVSYQVGAVLLVGCVGGKNAAALSQIAYITLGLSPWFPVFSQGGGWDYLSYPTFGYILGFLPGGWLCGWLAFRNAVSIETLAVSSFCGLAIVHLVGAFYLTFFYGLGRDWLAALDVYSWQLLPGQLAIVCASTVLAFALRRVLFVE